MLLAAGRASLEEVDRERGRVIDVSNATDFLFCVRYTACVYEYVCVLCFFFFCFFSELLLSSTLQANTNIPEAGVAE